MTLDKIEKNIERAQQELDFWAKIKELRLRYEVEPLGTYPEAAYRAYVLSVGVTDAAKLLNDQGMRFESRKFKSDDISDAIHNMEIEDTCAMDLVKQLHAIQTNKMKYKT